MDTPKENLATERLAAETILHRGVKVKIAAPWFIRWLKKTVTIRLTSPYEGTMHRVATYYLSAGIKSQKLEEITVEESLALMSLHGKAISKAVACAILNGYFAGNKLFTRILAHYLRWHCKPRELFALATALLIYGGTSDFMNTTRSVRRMTITPPNLGQKTKGS